MPVPKGTKYRMVKQGGGLTRLAIAPSGKVVETKKMPSAKKGKKK